MTMSRSLLFLVFLTLIASCTNQLPEDLTNVTELQQDAPQTKYDRSALQKMKWLAGAWKGETPDRKLEQSFLFQMDLLLESFQLAGNSNTASHFFLWKDGKYFYGQQQQWMVTWIGEKDIRFDPVTPGIKPMTWTRLNDKKWHLIRHGVKWNETIVMERVGDIQS